MFYEDVCPKCGNYMKFQMEYCCGEPFILHTCTCGYHYPNNEECITYGTSTETLNCSNI